MNIALTYFCNQKCPYCFARDAMSIVKQSPQVREITIDNLNKVMNFMKKSGVSCFRMAGGEPTLHSRFEEIYDIISNNDFSVTILSNGIIDKHKIEFLAKKNNLKSILLNIRHPGEYLVKDWEKLLYVLSRLNKKIILSFRVYKLDFDAQFLFDLIEEYKLIKLINWAIACPSLGRNNVYVRLDDHEKVVNRMIEFSRESKRYNIQWCADSGFVLCAFNDGKLKELKENVNFIPDTNCYPGIEVAPDLKVSRCFGMAQKARLGLKITDFNSLKDAEKHFFMKSLPLKRMGGMDRCFKCRHLVSRRCGGGCMVHILKEFPIIKIQEQFFKTYNQLTKNAENYRAN